MTATKEGATASGGRSCCLRSVLGLKREDAIEMYYNAALTRWLSVTADLQIINPALTKTLGSDGRLQNVDTAVVAGLRIYARF